MTDRHIVVSLQYLFMTVGESFVTEKKALTTQFQVFAVVGRQTINCQRHSYAVFWSAPCATVKIQTRGDCFVCFCKLEDLLPAFVPPEAAKKSNRAGSNRLAV